MSGIWFNVLQFCTGENRVLAVNAGAIDALVAVMRAHKESADVSKPACFALGKVFCINGAL